MKLLQEIHAFASRKHRGAFDFVTTIQDLGVNGYFVPDFDVHVSFNYTPKGYTQHVQGDPTTRERHSAEVEIVHAVLLKDLHFYDEEGQSILKTFHRGLPVEEIPGWNEELDDALIDEAFNNAPEPAEMRDY